MGADLSRIRSNPLLDFAGVELKQGAVVLDADFNELVAIADRRIRAAASDVLGRSRVSSTTPDAFRVTVNAAGSLDIGKGRLYVDGVLAECHGGSVSAASKRFDPLMAEPAFPDPLTYATQPFLGAPPALPAAGRHLVYLDVWEREVTHLEWPAVVEPAVNVETSSRKQVVWQVRVLDPDAGAADCASVDGDIQGWAAVIAPSAGRLTTGTYDPPAASDPCELPPTGGYRGLENQTYRVEIHGAGPLSGATFKWSRENASVGSRVTVIVEKGKLELASLGRDDVLRFNTGDWVEIIDDDREQSQLCGEMRRITVDEAARTIAFVPDLPAAMLPSAAAPLADPAFPRIRNLRVRRWDHKHQVMQVDAAGLTSLFHDLDAVGATGAIPVPPAGTTLVLENGVTVQFAAAGGGRFRAGDHWVFAARTTDASVEVLSNEPPRGIHHHYARLGVWNVATGLVSDCRKHWPPDGGGHDCSCTQCVTPESHSGGTLTIQQAVSYVAQRGGGTVCISIGQYRLDEPVVLRDTKSVRIRGEGVATMVFASKAAFVMADTIGVVLEDMTIVSLGSTHAVQVRTCQGAVLQRLVVASLASGDFAAAIGLSGVVIGAVIRENTILAQDGIVSGEVKGTLPGTNAFPEGLLGVAGLRIEDNFMLCGRTGIRFTGLAIHLLGNVIDRNELAGFSDAAIKLLGIGAPGSSMRIRGNDIASHGDGVVVAVEGLGIEGNRIVASKKGSKGAGILLSPGLDQSGPDDCVATANAVQGFSRGGLVVASRTRELIAKQNLIDRCGMGICIEEGGSVENASIDNNHLSDITPGDAKTGIVAAVAVRRSQSVSVCGNIVRRVGQDGAVSLVAGIVALDVERIRVTGNDVTDIGPAGDYDNFRAAGILVLSPFTSVEVEQNQVERESTPRQQVGGRFVAVWIGEPKMAATPGATVGKIAGYATVKAATKSIVFGAGGATYVKGPKVQPGANAARASASVIGNTIGSRGTMPAVIAFIEGDCLFGQNRCEWRAGRDAAVELAGEAIIVDGNRVRTGSDFSIRITGNTKAATVLGNVTTRPIRLGNAALPAPWVNLNIVA